MGVTAIVVSVIVAPIAVYGVYKGISYLVNVSREKNKTKLETQNTGENCAKLEEGLKEEFKNNKMQIDNEEELSQVINEIKDNKKDQFKMKIEITRDDDSKFHLEDEENNLYEINKTFGKSYTFLSDVIFVSNCKNFDDSDFKILMRIKWENLQEIILPHNNITIINPLTNFPLVNLQKIDLSYNLIEDIDDLQDVNMIKLESVNLKNNKIDSPSVFINKNFFELKYLNLLNNNFDDNDKEKFTTKYKKKNPNIDLHI